MALGYALQGHGKGWHSKLLSDYSGLSGQRRRGPNI